MDIEAAVRKMIENGKKSRFRCVLVEPDFQERSDDVATDQTNQPTIARPDNSEILAAYNTAAKTFFHVKYSKLHIESAELAFNEGSWKGICSVKPISIKEMPDGSINNTDISKALSLNAHRLHITFFHLAGVAAELIVQDKISSKDFYEHEDFKKAVWEERKSFFIPLNEQEQEQRMEAQATTEQQLHWVISKISYDVSWSAITSLAKELLVKKKLSGLRCTRILDKAVTDAKYNLR